MSEADLHEVLKSQLDTVMKEHKGGQPTWKNLPKTDCQVGHHGKTNLLRIPINLAPTTNWKTLNNLLKKRVSGGPPSFIHLGFDPSNTIRLAPFLVELVDKTDNSNLDPSEVLDELLSTWSSLWGGATAIFDREQQIGALGELLVLEKLMEVKPSQNTLECWKAPEMQDDLHDFEADSGHIEIKTSSSVPRKFYVGSLDQMDPEKISPKPLILVFVKLVNGTDFTLPEAVNRIRERCSELGISVPFDDLLKKRGYRDSEAEEYSEMSFDLDGIDYHTIDESTPIFTTSNLDEIYPAVVRVRQTVDPTLIDFSTINSNDWKSITDKIGI